MSATPLRALAAAALMASLGAYAQLVPVSKVSPEFPREAQLASVEKGRVKARLTLDATGEVTRVDIIEANPRRVFDRAVVRSLSQWRYASGAAGRTVEVDLDFKLQ
ncbi:MAG TPA: TonB family protein [Usitatibacter sp.]|nr:TonB family protein [Usitatibacter sp.]